MKLKIFKAAWFLSVLAVLANLLYVYASLPEEVVVQDELGNRVMASRELLFYVVVALVAVVNVLVYVISRLFADDLDFRAWFHGLVITFNIFFILGLNVVQVYNSGERFDFSHVGMVIYASVFLMIGWAASWPIYGLFRKFFAKQAVS